MRSNLTMMSDMMSQLDPVTVKQADMELLEVKKKKNLKKERRKDGFFHMKHEKITSIHSFWVTSVLPLTDLVRYTFCVASTPSIPHPHILCLIVSLAVIHSL